MSLDNVAITSAFSIFSLKDFISEVLERHVLFFTSHCTRLTLACSEGPTAHCALGATTQLGEDSLLLFLL